MSDYRDLPPVPEDERPDPPRRLSTTKLDRADKCRRSLYLDLKHNGGAGSHAMYRGSLFHLFAERAMWTLIENQEENLYAAAEGEDPAHAKQNVASLTAAIVDEVARENPGMTVPAAEIDDVREMAYHWAVGYDVSPSSIVGLEDLFVLDVEGVTVSGKIDVLYHADGALGVDDFKSSFFMPSSEEFATSFQTRLYAALVAFGKPVVREKCEACENGCERCVRGYTETVGERISAGVNRFRCREVYPRYLTEEGRLQTREITWTRAELSDFLADVGRLVAQVKHSLDTGLWPAVPGSHCSMCPCPMECPIPAALRNNLGTIETPEQAEAAMALVTVEELQLKAIKADSKKFAPIVVGDQVWEVKASTSRSLDEAALAQAVEHSLRTGQPIDFDAHRKERTSTSFRKRKIKPEERAA